MILDHAGNIDEHNFVTDIIIEKLDGGKRRKKKAVKPKLTWKCCECRAVMPKIEVFCTSCGAKAPGQTTIIEHDIELVEITAPMCAPVTTVPATPIFTHVPSTTSLEDPKRFYRELRGLAKARNYSPQWCNYSFRARFGNWPNAFGSASAVAPSPEIIAWVETRNRAYAVRKRQEALAA